MNTSVHPIHSSSATSTFTLTNIIDAKTFAKRRVAKLEAKYPSIAGKGIVPSFPGASTPREAFDRALAAMAAEGAAEPNYPHGWSFVPDSRELQGALEAIQEAWNKL